MQSNVPNGVPIAGIVVKLRSEDSIRTVDVEERSGWMQAHTRNQPNNNIIYSKRGQCIIKNAGERPKAGHIYVAKRAKEK